jgi:hypothetical protein
VSSVSNSVASFGAERSNVLSNASSHASTTHPPHTNSSNGTEADSGMVKLDDIAKAHVLEVLGQEHWDRVAGGIASIVPASLPRTKASSEIFQMLAERIKQHPNRTLVLFPPRGIGPTEWTRDAKKRGHIRRRFMLLGQTQDAMRIWDTRRAIAAVRKIPAFDKSPLTLAGSDHAAMLALYASLFDLPVNELELNNLSNSHQDGAVLLNVSRVVSFPKVIERAVSRVKLARVNQAE